MINVGIIGNGFVGSAVAHGFSPCATVRTYDKDEKLSTHSFNDVVKGSEFIVVSVPTPSNEKKGTIDLAILDSVIEEISHIIPTDSVVIIKSTTIPGTTDGYIEKYPHMNIVFNPEFLSEKTAKMDFMNPARIIIGGRPTSPRERVKNLYEARFPYTNIIETDAKTAEFIKYMCNCFYAIKISAFNEFYQIAEELNIDWEICLEGLISSQWVNKMHTQVPGPDGSFGFGGKCFPKDISAFITFAKNNGISPLMLSSAWEKNIEVRTHKNWKRIKGAFTKGK